MQKDCINDFGLIEVNKSSFTEEEYEQAKEAGLMIINGCSRKIIAGRQEDLDWIKERFTSSYLRLDGKDAYAHILQFITGQFSKTRGESQVVDQFKSAWKEFALHAPDKAKQLEYLYNSLREDNATLRSNVTQELLPAFYETTAHNMSNQTQGGERVLVVASANSRGDGPSDVAFNLIKQLGNNRAKQAGEILVTHPDANVLERIMQELRKRNLAVNPRAVPFEEVTTLQIDEKSNKDNLAWIPIIYNTLSMKEYPEANQALLESCKEHEVFGGQLVHLGGPTKPDRITSGVWQNNGLCNAIMPEAITAQQQLDQQRNEAIISGSGRCAAQNCAYSRSLGKSPVKSFLQYPPEDYANRTSSRMERSAP